MSVYPNGTCLNLHSQLIRALHVRRPDGTSEAVVCVVCLLDGFVVGGETEEWYDWA